MSMINDNFVRDSDRGRFWSKVDQRSESECWMWKGSVNKKGYGSFTLSRQVRVTKIAHRVAYLLSHHKLDTNLLVCHSCDTPGCCNPDHLFQGTPADNSRDMRRKGRSPRGERRSLLTEADVKAIRAAYKTGRFEQSELAKKFNMTQQGISHIIQRTTWSHIA